MRLLPTYLEMDLNTEQHKLGSRGVHEHGKIVLTHVPHTRAVELVGAHGLLDLHRHVEDALRWEGLIRSQTHTADRNAVATKHRNLLGALVTHWDQKILA